MERVCAALPPARIPAAFRGASAVLPARARGTASGMFAVCGGGVGAAGARPLDWLDGTRPGAAAPPSGGEYATAGFSLGAAEELSQPCFGAGGASNRRRLATALRLCPGVAGNVCGVGPSSGDLLSSGELDSSGGDTGTGTDGSSEAIFVEAPSDLRLPAGGGFSGGTGGEGGRGGEER